jgi:hypothetical protein
MTETVEMDRQCSAGAHSGLETVGVVAFATDHSEYGTTYKVDAPKYPDRPLLLTARFATWRDAGVIETPGRRTLNPRTTRISPGSAANHFLRGASLRREPDARICRGSVHPQEQRKREQANPEGEQGQVD